MSIVSTNKYTLYKEQVSYDGGHTWEYTGNEYAGLLEADSMECGYIPPYKLKLDMVGGEEITIPYTGNTIVSSGEVNSYKETSTSVTFGKARSIADGAFKVWQILESVTMYDIRSIGDSAFTNCYLLKDVNLGYNLTTIGGYAFNGCGGVTSIDLPNSVTSIGSYAFAGCGISNITIPSGVTSISNYTFMGCGNLTSVTIPSSVTSIGDGVFRSCTSLTSITIPSSVTSIGDWAFMSCSGLTKVVVDDLVAWCNISFKDSYTNSYSESNPLYYAHHLYSNENTEITDLIIPNTITNIKQYAFYRCYGLESVTIPSSVTSISYGSFTDCENLTSITVEATTPPSLYSTTTTSGSTLSPFYNTNNCPIYVPCESIEAYKTATDWSTYASRITCSVKAILTLQDSSTVEIFNDGNSTLTNSDISPYSTTVVSVEIKKSVSDIGDNAFYGCTSLTSITIPNSVSFIGDSAFTDCSSITSVTIPSGVTSIGDNAFYGCTSLTSITIPSGITSIGDSAFYGCTSLTSITSNATTPPTLGTSAFDNTNDCLIYVPWGTINEYKTDWSDYESRIVLQPATFKARLTNQNSSTVDIPLNGSSTLSSSETRTYSASVVSAVITTAVTKIGSYAFNNYTKLTSIDIPNTVTTIGDRAFLSSGLISIDIPSGVTSIEEFAFAGCSSLTSVTIPNGVTKINDDTFKNCTRLASITIPNSVRIIGESAFTNCGLTTIELPSSITSIYAGAFRGSGLNTITSLNTTAPTLSSNVFYGLPSSGTLYYPTGSNYTTWRNALPSGWTLTPI